MSTNPLFEAKRCYVLNNLRYTSTVDRLEGELMSELENARLVRLLCKFGFINERPESIPLLLKNTALLTNIIDSLGNPVGLKLVIGISSSYSAISSFTKWTKSVTP